MYKFSTHTIPGTVIKGYGIASGSADNSPYPDGSVIMQIPHFKKRGLNLNRFFGGTLNISIAPLKFIIKKPDYCFQKVKWYQGTATETFSFISCMLVIKKQAYIGNVYYPHPETKPAHFHDNTVLEVITSYIPNITYGDQVRLKINNTRISLTQ